MNALEHEEWQISKGGGKAQDRAHVGMAWQNPSLILSPPEWGLNPMYTYQVNIPIMAKPQAFFYFC